MKKVILSLAISLLTIICVATTSFAADTIVESPNVKIIIDGKTGTYEDVPVVVNGSTMLPLRALLVNLGVQNDNEHIIWNGDEKSVTIIKDAKKIVLQINNKTAYVDDSPVTLVASPILYKNKSYIPARFVAQSLGKTVIWDGSTSAVLIRDTTEFNKVKEVLDKANAAMKTVERFKYNADADVTMKDNGKDMKTKVTANCAFDKKNMVIHTVTDTEVLGQKVQMEMYIGSNAMYMLNSQTKTWQKIPLEGELFAKAFEDSGNAAMMEYTEAVCAGLVMENNADSKDIVLKGDIYLEDLFKASGMKMEGLEIAFDKMYVEMTIDKDTYLTKSANMDVTITMKMLGQSQQISEKINCTYSDYNGSFQVVIPEEAKAAKAIGE